MSRSQCAGALKKAGPGGEVDLEASAAIGVALWAGVRWQGARALERPVGGAPGCPSSDVEAQRVFIRSFNKCLLRTYYLPDVVLDSGGTVNIENSTCMELMSSWGKLTNK